MLHQASARARAERVSPPYQEAVLEYLKEADRRLPGDLGGRREFGQIKELPGPRSRGIEVASRERSTVRSGRRLAMRVDFPVCRGPSRSRLLCEAARTGPKLLAILWLVYVHIYPQAIHFTWYCKPVPLGLAAMPYIQSWRAFGSPILGMPDSAQTPLANAPARKFSRRAGNEALWQ